MYRLFVLATVLFYCAVSASAQTPQTMRAYDLLNAGKLDSAKLVIDKAFQFKEVANDPVAWYISSYVSKEKYKQERDELFRKKAIEDAKHSLELDSEDKISAQVYPLLEYLANSYFNEASADMEREQYAQAAIGFEAYTEVCQMVKNRQCDQKAVFYIGYCAYKAEDHGKARKFLKQSMENGYPDPLVYYFLARSYYQTGETEVALNIIEEGHLKYPDNVDILLSQINYYRSLRRFDDSEKVLRGILAVDPDNVDFTMLLALNFESKADGDSLRRQAAVDSAKVYYERVITLDSENLQANFNLGILYYNEAVSIINNLDYDTEPGELDHVQDRTEEKFRRSLPYMRKAYLLNPKRKETLEGLSNIYKALNEKGKSQVYEQKLTESN